MNLNSPVARAILGVIAVGLITYGAYRFYVQAAGSTAGAITAGVVIAMWVLFYLAFRKWLRKSN